MYKKVFYFFIASNIVKDFVKAVNVACILSIYFREEIEKHGAGEAILNEAM